MLSWRVESQRDESANLLWEAPPSRSQAWHNSIWGGSRSDRPCHWADCPTIGHCLGKEILESAAGWSSGTHKIAGSPAICQRSHLWAIHLLVEALQAWQWRIRPLTSHTALLDPDKIARPHAKASWRCHTIPFGFVAILLEWRINWSAQHNIAWQNRIR